MSVEDVSGDDVRRIIDLMESRENWTIDDENIIRDLLVQMARRYHSPLLADWALNNTRAALAALGALSTGKCIEIVQALDEKVRGFANALLVVARKSQGDPVVSLYPRRLVCLARAGLLSQIFSPDRFQAIEAVLKHSCEEVA